VDLATTIVFTNDPLLVSITAVKAVHITELRAAVNAIRTLAGLGAGTFTDPSLLAGMTPRAAHITELRSSLDDARNHIGLSPQPYADGTIAAGATLIKAAHVLELRNGMK
jgi:hypothetical protein